MEEKKSVRDNIRAFFNRRNARAIAYIFWIGAAYALTVNLVSVYSSTVLEDLGASSVLAEIGTLIIDVVGTLGVVITLFTVDRLGRRLIGLLGFELSAVPVAVLILAYILHFLSIPPLVIGMFSLFFLINVGFVGTLQYVPAAEVSATNARGGLSVGWEKLFEFGLALPALTLYAAIGLYHSLIYDFVMVIVAGIVLYLLSYETAGRSLEENAEMVSSGRKDMGEKETADT